MMYTRSVQSTLPSSNNVQNVAQATCDAGDIAVTGGCQLVSDDFFRTEVRLIRQYTGPGMSPSLPDTTICQAYCPNCSFSSGGTKVESTVTCVAVQ